MGSWWCWGTMDPSLMVTGAAGKADLPFINDQEQVELNPALSMSSPLLKLQRQSAQKATTASLTHYPEPRQLLWNIFMTEIQTCFRIVCDRNPPYTARIFAAGFDSSKNIFLGEKAAKWKNPDGHMDGLTTNGVLVMHPKGGFTEESKPGVWREISVCGDVYTLRETRSAQHRGKLVENETNVLQDGSLIDLCGATLLWRTADGLLHSPTQKHIEALRQEINAARPQCPVGFNTLAFPSMTRKDVVKKKDVEEKQPWAYLSCGHVHGYHNWGHRSDAEVNERECPMCRTVGRYVPLWLGCEAGFYVDAGPPTHAFTPCGHVCSEKTAKYWAQIPLPHGTHAFHAACPFCATQLTGDNCVKLIFQGPID
ncbi:E3 ubiquitin-protein ligase pellino homolog 2 isoform X2 [Melospiza georgiana]|uniref:E3 ubiquitin-protein ligase pellino homolog 2 isoform X2 n=1 Tax=Melospiza georgiana TaxID=44398 RepID=UPI0025AB81E2|nr:E3 ubiquitin-protein ligase pellino homolog 2 isoform X2 [Melospiza georgiana]